MLPPFLLLLNQDKPPDFNRESEKLHAFDSNWEASLCVVNASYTVSELYHSF